MTPDLRKGLVRRFNDEVWNKGNLGVFEEAYATNCSFHDPTFPADGVTGAKEKARELRAAVPDLHLDVHEILADADLTAYRWTMGGTSRGEFRGLPATGKTYVMTGMTIDKWEDDRVVESWSNYDMLGGLQQLGIIPETTAQQATR